ncbi:MAG: hypothetical protein KatS3mg102_2810 [Planctomycetota bacterium]|nr:MAG: hypothetical protein KatS3mg102_2810 [Planctomycetota bacterium]
MAEPVELPRWVERAGGLCFRCTGCGRCCEGPQGYVWLEEGDVQRLARHLGMELHAFGRRYVRRVNGELALLDQSNGDCIFYRRGRGCTVYPARPRQCRTYPFWPEIVRNAGSWRAEAERCPGIGFVAAEAAGGAPARLSPARVLALLRAQAGQGPEREV